MSKSQVRGRNFGKRCRALLHLPLATSVASRVQIRGRITRADQAFDEVTEIVLVPRGTCLHALHEHQRSSNSLQRFFEVFIELASKLRQEHRE